MRTALALAAISLVTACSQLLTRSAAASTSRRFVSSGSCVVMPTGQRPV